MAMDSATGTAFRFPAVLHGLVYVYTLHVGFIFMCVRAHSTGPGPISRLESTPSYCGLGLRGRGQGSNSGHAVPARVDIRVDRRSRIAASSVYHCARGARLCRCYVLVVSRSLIDGRLATYLVRCLRSRCVSSVVCRPGTRSICARRRRVQDRRVRPHPVTWAGHALRCGLADHETRR